MATAKLSNGTTLWHDGDSLNASGPSAVSILGLLDDPKPVSETVFSIPFGSEQGKRAAMIISLLSYIVDTKPRMVQLDLLGGGGDG